ncbi:hypothetical protein [Nitrosomonas oligotropha]|uniref:hypothetical protein n=1 Tax=Nitrosomonas oligotropha TaxID=42354 RepID=UPI00136ADC60|nr:hypothetical protein [Nitrosomonas oligotropha]MXS81546.1 hypothetical protein [Nitrosomonas oligotropha]
MVIKNVQIIEKSTSKVVFEYPTYESEGLSNDKYCDEAWGLAIEEGFVNEFKRDDYEIKVVTDDGKLDD